jgi:fructose-bisphosphate aldolase class 1
MRAWRGDAQNVARARQAFDHRLAMNSLAREGRWSEAAERAAA